MADDNGAARNSSFKAPLENETIRSETPFHD
jgi:hypothetical protein